MRLLLGWDKKKTKSLRYKRGSKCFYFLLLYTFVIIWFYYPLPLQICYYCKALIYLRLTETTSYFDSAFFSSGTWYSTRSSPTAPMALLLFTFITRYCRWYSKLMMAIAQRCILTISSPVKTVHHPLLVRTVYNTLKNHGGLQTRS